MKPYRTYKSRWYRESNYFMAKETWHRFIVDNKDLWRKTITLKWLGGAHFRTKVSWFYDDVEFRKLSHALFRLRGLIR